MSKIFRLHVHLCLIGLLLFSVGSAQAQVQKPAAPATPQQVEILGTQLLHITSAITHQDYDLYINFPRGYDDTTKSFPVVYVTDAQWDFTLVQALYGQLYYDGFMPGAITVGITWGGKNPDYDKARAHDLTPTDPDRHGAYGNAANFLSFIRKEAIPLVEGKYRIKRNDRTLTGSSFAGLFTLYAMFQAPGVFNRFVATSPALQWDNEVITSIEKSYVDQHKELPAKVFVGIGEYENVKDFQKWMDTLKGKGLKNLELQTEVVTRMGHAGAKGIGFARGLQAVFARPDIKVDPAVLATYAGEYEINPMGKVTVTQENGKLVAVTPDGSRVAFLAESDADFYLMGQLLNVHFDKDQTGKVSGFALHQYSGDQVCKKVK